MKLEIHYHPVNVDEPEEVELIFDGVSLTKDPRVELIQKLIRELSEAGVDIEQVTHVS